MLYAVLAEVVYIAELANKYILLKYNCTGKFAFVAVVVYIIKQLFYSLSSFMSDSQLGAIRTSSAISSYTTRVRRVTVNY